MSTATVNFEGYVLEVDFEVEWGMQRTFHEEGSNDRMEIHEVRLYGVEVGGLMGEDMLNKLEQQMWKELEKGDE